MEKPLIGNRLYTIRAADAMDPQSELITQLFLEGLPGENIGESNADGNQIALV